MHSAKNQLENLMFSFFHERNGNYYSLQIETVSELLACVYTEIVSQGTDFEKFRFNFSFTEWLFRWSFPQTPTEVSSFLVNIKDA